MIIRKILYHHFYAKIPHFFYLMPIILSTFIKASQHPWNRPVPWYSASISTTPTSSKVRRLDWIPISH
jgi:hypothetical protein